ncbi:MAG: glycosyltransferase family 39 protein [Candidatus Azambacteria bacterium]|nr:glycosyltransferase family 39 protein [Candidatus Azambacteria bacterium]
MITNIKYSKYLYYYLSKKLFFFFLLALSVELLMIFFLSRINGIELFFRGDGRDYQNLANNLIYHQTLAITPEPPYLPTSFRTPIYPFWLAFIYLIFQSYKAAIFVGALVFAISAPLVYLIGREIFAEKIAFASAILFAIEPWALYQAGFLSAEQIFMPIFLLSIYFFCRYLKYGTTLQLCLASLILGIAVLTRPAALFFVVVFIFLAFVFELRHSIWQSFRASALISLIFIAVLIPWLIRNKIVLDSWQFSSASGIRIFSDYIMLEKYLGKEKPGKLVDIYERARQLLNIKNDWDTMTVENSQKMSLIALKEIKANFGSFTAMYLKNTGLYFFKNSYGNIFLDLGISGYNIQSKVNSYFKQIKDLNIVALISGASLGAKLLIILSVFWPLITFLAFIGGLNMLKQNWQNLLFWFLILWIVYFSFITATARDLSRYRLAIHAPLFLLAVYGFYHVRNGISNVVYKIKNYFFDFIYKNE